MSRTARIVIPNVPHHVTQRGNNREDVFFVDDDRRAYLQLLAEHASEFRLDILAWCLMTNHVHLVVVPRDAASLARAIGRTDFLYTQRINRRDGREGHLWRNRFYSCALDEKHAVAAVRYVERNPVRARIVRQPWDYPWSSARAHVSGKDSFGLLDLDAWLREWPAKTWRDMLRTDLDEIQTEQMRRSTRLGRPLGSDAFVARIEKLIGRAVRSRAAGRPALSAKSPHPERGKL